MNESSGVSITGNHFRVVPAPAAEEGPVPLVAAPLDGTGTRSY
jgi:hypothetical protein